MNSDSRCEVCDRPFADPADWIDDETPWRDDRCYLVLFAKGNAIRKDRSRAACSANKVDWRSRALAAEATVRTLSDREHARLLMEERSLLNREPPHTSLWETGKK